MSEPAREPTDVSFIVAGQAGQGVQLASELLGRALFRGGYYVLASENLMSRIRGGHDFTRVRVSDSPVAADGDQADLVLSLDPGLVESHCEHLAENGIAVVDEGAEVESGEGIELVKLPLERVARELGKSRLMSNAVGLGAVVGLLDYDFGKLEAVLGERFAAKGQDPVRRNVACARAGYGLGRRYAGGRGSGRAGVSPRTKLNLPVQGQENRFFLSGAEAMALGAVAAGIKFVAGYPMSPATPILEACAGWAARTGMVVEQPEDEIAGINMAIGAAFAGARAMVCTAGGGLALMNEGLSLAGMTETGVVVCSGMRPGPATGLATRTAQADLLFAIHCGHGEFPRVVLAPADAGQAFEAVQRAASLAAKYQTPAFVLFDQFLADAYWTVDGSETAAAEPGGESGLLRPEPYQYRRYEPSDSGVSTWLPPGTRDQLVYVDSDEHTAEGHITESAEVRTAMVEKRLRKSAGIAAELSPPQAYPPDSAELAACCFGSTRGVVTEAVDRLRTRGMSVAAVHFCDLWPFPSPAVAELAKRYQRFVTVENNYSGQLGQLIIQETGLRIDASVRRFDGRPFRVADVEQELERLLERGGA